MEMYTSYDKHECILILSNAISKNSWNSSCEFTGKIDNNGFWIRYIGNNSMVRYSTPSLHFKIYQLDKGARIVGKFPLLQNAYEWTAITFISLVTTIFYLYFAYKIGSKADSLLDFRILIGTLVFIGIQFLIIFYTKSIRMIKIRDRNKIIELLIEKLNIK